MAKAVAVECETATTIPATNNPTPARKRKQAVFVSCAVKMASLLRNERGLVFRAGRGGWRGGRVAEASDESECAENVILAAEFRLGVA